MTGLYTPLRTPSLKDPRKNPKPFTGVQSPWIQGIGVECVGFGGGVYGFACRLNGSEIPEPVWGGSVLQSQDRPVIHSTIPVDLGLIPK